MTDLEKREALASLAMPADDSPGFVAVLQLRNSVLIRVTRVEDEQVLDAIGARAFFYA